MDRESDLKLDFVNFEEDFEESHSYPMGILYISAYLKKNGFTNIGYVDHICLLRKIEQTKALSSKRPAFETWESIRERREKNLGGLVEYLKGRQPRIILLGPITTVYLVELKDLVERLREHFSDPLILAGGPHFGRDERLDRELLTCCPGLDGVVIGEAEETIFEIADRFYYLCGKDKTVPSRFDFFNKSAEIKGILTKDKMLRRRDPIKLENLPSPDMGLLEEYWNNPKIRANYYYSLSKRRNPVTRTSRGIVDDYSGDGD
jgi:radical SAM superfamily enzyme YgiQ (UPF0313 family)